MPAELKAETERNRREALSEGVIRRLKLNNKLVVQANGEEKRRQRSPPRTWYLQKTRLCVSMRCPCVLLKLQIC